ncbi:MAG: hypothetical protein MK132_27470 [Lentisphaerales bacterium]|nr:hypothetical protein [Lentisphaerales bacterium]
MKYVLIAFITIFLSGCSTEGAKFGTAVRNIGINYNGVGLLNDSIHDSVAIEGTDWTRSATDTAQVWASLRNRTDSELVLQARTHFYDRSKMPIEKVSGWRQFFIPANGSQTYKESSISIDVGYYYIEVREAK